MAADKTYDLGHLVKLESGCEGVVVGLAADAKNADNKDEARYFVEYTDKSATKETKVFYDSELSLVEAPDDEAQEAAVDE